MAHEESRRVVDHKTVRIGIGIVALLMPISVLLFSNIPLKQMDSISASYWTDSRDIFVGCLTAVAFALASYNGTGICNKDTEYWLSKLAGLSALIVAFVPARCKLNSSCDYPANWVAAVSVGYHDLIHTLSAIVLFACLVLLMGFFSLRAKYKRQYIRSNGYCVISLLMLVGIPLIYLFGNNGQRYAPMFWSELYGLALFGFGWLCAGSYRSKPHGINLTETTEIACVLVEAKKKNNATFVVIKPGMEYLFVAKGCWADWLIGCGANGWGPDWNPLNYFNRIKWKPIFTLCGSIGANWNDPTRTFVIGEQASWTAPSSLQDLNEESRRLYLFANDWQSRYGNNKGQLTVNIYERPTQIIKSNGH